MKNKGREGKWEKKRNRKKKGMKERNKKNKKGRQKMREERQKDRKWKKGGRRSWHRSSHHRSSNLLKVCGLQQNGNIAQNTVCRSASRGMIFRGQFGITIQSLTA